jgi:putative FmdB family regulatory protein
MPLFAYRCSKCEESSELLVRGGEAPVCPSCGSTELEKQMSHFAPMKAAESSGAPACSSCCQASGSCPYQS